MYGEDVELSYRFRNYGYRMRYIARALIVHHVDLDDSSLRPHQLSGSLAANVLLRYRYGTRREGIIAHGALRYIHSREYDQERKRAMASALAIIKNKKTKFLKHPVTHNAHHPFSGFDYTMRRDGHDCVLDIKSLQSASQTVSIITRTHGESLGYLRECIACVLNQTYKSIEHIIVEDKTCFAQNLVEETKKKYDSKIRYVRSNEGGRSRAANCGFSIASGDLWMILDNDDLLFSDHVETLVSSLISNVNAVAAYSLAWEVQTTLPLESEDGFLYDELMHELPTSHRRNYSQHRLVVENFIPIQSLLFKRELHQRFGGMSEELEALEDWNLWLRYSRGGKFCDGA
jgi:GT2 family glycosyltransferase